MGNGEFHYEKEKGGKVMRTIWKFELKVGENKIDMPEISELLTAQFQDGKLMLWAEVDSTSEKTQRPFLVTGTGVEIGADLALEYIATAQEGEMVWHVFEVL